MNDLFTEEDFEDDRSELLREVLHAEARDKKVFKIKKSRFIRRKIAEDIEKRAAVADFNQFMNRR